MLAKIFHIVELLVIGWFKYSKKFVEYLVRTEIDEDRLKQIRQQHFESVYKSKFISFTPRNL